MSESTFDLLMQSGPTHNAQRQARATMPMMGGQRALASADNPVEPRPRIDADELIDVRQRAEFFVTLGQTDQAVQVLEARIALDATSCPQVHLDLLKLFHSLGLTADFNQVSADFMQLFNTRVPDFAHFDHEGQSLEEYPGAIDRLIAAWHRPTVLDTLEQMIYRNQGDGASVDGFDLAALRELLLLHAVAQSIGGAAGRRTGAATAPHGGTDADSAVDIDLSELFTPLGMPTLVLPQEAAPSSLPDTVAVASVAPSGNLIDFDLSEADFIKKPDQNS